MELEQVGTSVKLWSDATWTWWKLWDFFLLEIELRASALNCISCSFYLYFSKIQRQYLSESLSCPSWVWICDHLASALLGITAVWYQLWYLTGITAVWYHARFEFVMFYSLLSPEARSFTPICRLAFPESNSIFFFFFLLLVGDLFSMGQ